MKTVFKRIKKAFSASLSGLVKLSVTSFAGVTGLESTLYGPSSPAQKGTLPRFFFYILAGAVAVVVILVSGLIWAKRKNRAKK
jgi:hypothetical protein